MKKITLSLLVSATILATGCATQTAILKSNNAATPTYQKSEHFFIGGIGQEKNINANDICKGAHNIAKVQSTVTPKDVLLSAITFGIYTPRTAKVYCQ
ncbi:MAG: Bor family protein [Acinetobacter sp.]|nr:Bor family protein [Acinetobacter sp.]